MTTKKKLSPSLRFSEFNGEWIEKRLDDIGKYFGGGTPDTSISEYWNGDIPWISSSDINEDSIHIIQKTRFISKKAIEKSATKFIPKGSLLMVSRVGIGKFAIADEGLCTSQDFTNLVTNQNEYFLGYYFKGNSNKFIRLSQGTSIKGFTTKDIKLTKFPLPSISEQQKIANFLTTIDSSIQQITRKSELLQQYKKGVMQQIFSQQIRFKDEGGKAFPDWNKKELGESAKINPRNQNLPNTFIYIDLESVEKGRLKKEQIIQKENAPSRAQRILKKNDILFQTVRPYQKNNYFFDKMSKYEYVASTGYAQVRTKENSNYLYQFLHYQKFVNKVLVRCTGTSYPAINSNDLAKIKIPLPSLPEQEKIANFLTAIDKKISLSKEQLDKMQTYKKGLLQQMFV